MQGQYFDKKTWDRAALPAYAAVRHLLPDPVHPDADALGAYWKSWELALGSMRTPLSGSGFVSNFLYMEFSKSIFAHDTAIMLLFARYAHRAWPAIESLDNFYARQHDTGEICREIRLTGEDYWHHDGTLPMRVDQTQDGKQHYDWTPPYAGGQGGHVTISGMNDSSALMVAEWEYYRITGDAGRLRRVLPAQEKWFEAFERYLRDTNGLYITDWASADNAPRNWKDLAYGVDVASTQAFFAELLAGALEALGCASAAMAYRRKAKGIAAIIRERMWNGEAGFYFDLDRAGRQIPIKAAFGLFALLTEAPTPEHVARLAAHLEDPREFNRAVRVPSLAADEPGYCAAGAYCRGGVWPFINAMVLRGLERHGQQRLADAIALNDWQAHVQVYRDTGTVWEYLAPEKAEPGKTHDPGIPGWMARKDFAGWGAYAPIALLLEYAIGLRPDAVANTLTWNLQETRACGCRRYGFGDVVADVTCAARGSADVEPVVEVTANRPFTLVVNWGDGHTRRMPIEP